MRVLTAYYLILAFSLIGLASVNASEDDHSHKATEAAHEHGSEKHDEHNDHEEHGEGEEEVEASNVGADKGVLEASQSKGMKIAPEAIKKLGIETKEYKSIAGNLSLPRGSLVESKRERFVFVLVNGFFKNVDVSLVQKNSSSVTIKFAKPMDTAQIVVKGANFLRNIQVDIFSGDEGGHHH